MIRVPAKLTLEEVSRCITDIWSAISLLDRGPTANPDLHGRRLTNCGRSIQDADYVTREELKELEARIRVLES